MNSGEAPKFELPPVPAGRETGVDTGAEVLPAQESSVGQRQPASSGQLVPAASIPVPPSIPVPTTYQPSSVSTDDGDGGLTAAEIDRIEKEWVDKAKSIVARTHDDPFEQNNEMSKVKAEYIKKRFNRTIPTDDTVTV